MRPFSKLALGVALVLCAASQAAARDLDRRIAAQVQRLERLLPADRAIRQRKPAP